MKKVSIRLAAVAAAALAMSACTGMPSKSDSPGTCYASGHDIVCEGVKVYDSRFDVIPSGTKYGKVDMTALTLDGKVLNIKLRYSYIHAPHSISGSGLRDSFMKRIKEEVNSRSIEAISNSGGEFIRIAVKRTEMKHSPDRRHYVSFNNVRDLEIREIQSPVS